MTSKLTAYHAKYFAYELSILHANNGVDRLSQSLFDASVDLNPHQIEAALFALGNPLSQGVVLADEVGLGKTIEAGLVISQLWAERKRNLIIVCPAALRKQWAQELIEKFNIPSEILDARSWKQLQNQGIYNPLACKKVVIMSYHYAARIEDHLVGISWDLVVVDEAHKLRNAHRESNKMGQALRRAFNGRKKLLLTATPLQNSLIELYGISTMIDEHLFGDDKAFRKQFMQADSDQEELKARLSTFVKRTLRKQVLEYVKYTERKALTVPFTPSVEEQNLYDSIEAFLNRESSYALPKRHRHLTGLILRKLLASSSYAVTNTLMVMKSRLEELKNKKVPELSINFALQVIEDDDLDPDLLDEVEEVGENVEEEKLNLVLLDQEIKELEHYINQSTQIKNDQKALALLTALDQGFEQLEEMGAARKVIIFTESKRTQEYIARFLNDNGYQDKVVRFSGTNSDSESTTIYQNWKLKNNGTERVTGSPQVDKRTALIDHFKDSAEIMIATEAAAEGVNLQFCSLLINYDLPWNPQRVEQRIGRCHRYGQKFDVVVINFLNQRNQADQRVLELLTHKFKLFDGVFGASDSILGSVESGVDFEKRILTIYQECRSPEDIDHAFEALQKELEDDINQRMSQTQEALLEHFDEDVHDLLRIKLDQAHQRLDKVGRWFWDVTQFTLANAATFTDSDHSFNLQSNILDQPKGVYQLRNKRNKETVREGAYTYRISDPLGEYVIDSARKLDTPFSLLGFDYTNHPTKVSAVEKLKGKSGWLSLELLGIESLQTEEHLVFSAVTDDGQLIDAEVIKKLFNLGVVSNDEVNAVEPLALVNLKNRNIEIKLAAALDANNRFFQEERDKLEKWADDKIFAAEQALVDTKLKIKALKREGNQAVSLEDQQRIQEQLRETERKQRKQRREIFDVEDEISEKRDEMIDALKQRLQQRTSTNNLFTIRWEVI